eukprot:10383421-Heterocapsa_arctica.AAC.1
MAVISGDRAARTAEKYKGSMEVYSPPRVTAFAARHNLQLGWSLDLTTVDMKGIPWDFSKEPVAKTRGAY